MGLYTTIDKGAIRQKMETKTTIQFYTIANNGVIEGNFDGPKWCPRYPPLFQHRSTAIDYLHQLPIREDSGYNVVGLGLDLPTDTLKDYMVLIKGELDNEIKTSRDCYGLETKKDGINQYILTKKTMTLYTIDKGGVIERNFKRYEGSPDWEGYPPLFFHRGLAIKRRVHVIEPVNFHYTITEMELELPTELLKYHIDVMERELMMRKIRR